MTKSRKLEQAVRAAAITFGRADVVAICDTTRSGSAPSPDYDKAWELIEYFALMWNIPSPT